MILTWDLAKRAAIVVIVVMGAATIFAAILFGLGRCTHHDDTPQIVARKDEKTAASVSQAIGQHVNAANQDATLHIDLTNKDIRDAFDALPPPAPAVGPAPRELPSAPVDSVRDRLNESIARANRAADAANP